MSAPWRVRGCGPGVLRPRPLSAPGVALALSAGELVSSFELSTLFLLSVAEIHRVRLDEIGRR